jgi:hypothetical protein
MTNRVDPSGAEPGEFECPECGRDVTRGPSGSEYGHARGIRHGEQRCSRRPPAVDPNGPSLDHDGLFS